MSPSTPLHDTSGEPRAATAQYLSFVLGQELYALPIHEVKEIMEYAKPTPVPLAGQLVRGVINLRGSVVPVIDMARRFGLPDAGPRKRHCIVITELDMDAAGSVERLVLGMTVDAVNAVVEVKLDDVEPAPPFGTRIPSTFIQGIARLNGRMLTLVATERALALDELRASHPVSG